MDGDAQRPEERRKGRPSDGVFAPVALRSGTPSLGRWVAMMALAIGLAVAKPWAALHDDATAAVARSSVSPAAVAAPPASAPGAPSATGSKAAELEVDTLCFGTDIWLVAYVERWQGRTLRVWRALEPARSASGPDDLAIPILSGASGAVTQLGWCAPVVGARRPTGSESVQVWVRSATGTRAIHLERSPPTDRPSLFGAMYRSPTRSIGPLGQTVEDAWPAGRYVFRLVDGDRTETWFAIEVEPGA